MLAHRVRRRKLFLGGETHLEGLKRVILRLHGSASSSAGQRPLRSRFVRRSFDRLVDGQNQLRSLKMDK